MDLLIASESKRVKLPMPCDVFWQQLEEENKQTLFMDCHPFNSGVRPKRLWNQMGRETFHVKTCENFAILLSDTLTEMRCCNFLAVHYGLSRQWMPPESTTNVLPENNEVMKLRKNAKTYLHSLVPFDFRGVIHLEKGNEVRQFLIALLAYSSVFSYLDLYLFSTTIPLVIELNHHAKVVFYSTAEKYIPHLKFTKYHGTETVQKKP